MGLNVGAHALDGTTQKEVIVESTVALEQLVRQRDAAALDTMQQLVDAQWSRHWSEFIAETMRQDWCNARLALQKLQFLHKLQN